MRIVNIDGHKIHIRKVKTLPDQSLGEANFATDEIFVAQYTQGSKVSQAQMKHTICHELAHFYMFYMGMQELCNNEQFIDLLGGYMLQTFGKFIKI